MSFLLLKIKIWFTNKKEVEAFLYENFFPTGDKETGIIKGF